MFNLNDENFGGGVTIFNNGNAGKVNNVKISVEKLINKVNPMEPDYRVIFTDNGGNSVNAGFYYHKDNPMKDEKGNKDLELWLVQRVHSIAKAVVPADFVFPEVTNSKDALDVLLKIVKDNSEGKKVNVFVTYGTKNRPSKYLQTRYFNFIESVDTPEEVSRLKPAGGDLLERLIADDNTTSGTDNSGNTTTGAGW